MLLLGGALWLWSGARSQHERAAQAVRLLLRDSGAQLLDDTVALQSLALRRSASGWLRLVRSYGFEVSLDGLDRRRGRLTLAGRSVEVVELPELGPDLGPDLRPGLGNRPSRPT